MSLYLIFGFILWLCFVGCSSVTCTLMFCVSLWLVIFALKWHFLALWIQVRMCIFVNITCSIDVLCESANTSMYVDQLYESYSYMASKIEEKRLMYALSNLKRAPTEMNSTSGIQTSHVNICSSATKLLHWPDLWIIFIILASGRRGITGS